MLRLVERFVGYLLPTRLYGRLELDLVQDEGRLTSQSAGSILNA